MSVKCSDISAYMNEIAPEASAEEWDNAGFLVGDPDREVAKILVCL
ncbi:MAG: Nif3-like dinuclear metal center hexameric protein, partial [Clostridiales bacterium]|nr:Nif3-like dinuclear metal center hexameric protein [Clostridiales bacterium]